MNYNYKLFDVNGLLKDGNEIPISKGNNKVDMFYFHFEDHDYNDTYATISVTFPDGETLIGELPTSNADFTFKGHEYRGFSLLILDTLTAQAGVLSMTVNLKSNSDDRWLCSSQVKVTIHDSDVSTEPVITDAQYQQILQTMKVNYDTLNENKVDKDFARYTKTREVQDNDTIVLNQDGSIKQVALTDVYNIKTINGVSAIDKNVNIVSTDIPYNETNVGNELERINESVEGKVNITDGVFHREGNLAPSNLEPTGILNHYVDTYEDVSHWARLFLTDTKLKEGDLIFVNFRVDLKHDDISAGDYANFPLFFINMNENINTDIVIPAHQLGLISATINIKYNGDKGLYFKFESLTGVEITPQITSSIVRR